VALVAGLVVAAIFSYSLLDSPAERPRTGTAQLVSIQELPDLASTCQTTDEYTEASVLDRFGPSAYAQEEGGGGQRGQREEPGMISRPPVRTIKDTDPIYSAVAVDTNFNEVILMDNNNWALRVFPRTENTPAGVAASKEKRIIQGPETDIQFNNGLYIDPVNGDIYSVETDTGDKVVVFPREADGNIKPARILATPHRGFALAMDEERQELFVGVQHPPEIAVFRKQAANDEKPLRSLQGESTRLSDVHGVAIDTKNQRMYVANWGHVSDSRIAGTGRFEDPSISVYPLRADGDVAPMGVIQGPRTRLNWPAQIAIDPDTQDIYVANDIGHNVLVFRASDRGNVAPYRVIEGNRTGLMNPSGVFVDRKNNELWVSNFGNASAVVYPLNASGNVAPLRKIRSAPEGKVSLKFGKIEALAYDEHRDQVWVPNCVTHPQIAAFSRIARENEPPVRTLEGHATKISRTMHGFSYDPIHDEIVVNSPLAQAILTFRGAANGEEPPIRVIVGPKTKILGAATGALNTVTADPQHNEIFLPVGKGLRNQGTGSVHGVYVFNRLDDGDVAPKRILTGPETMIESPTPQLAVDPLRKLIVVKSGGALLIFDREANGNTKPLRVIRGPKTGGIGGGQITTYPEKGYILSNSRDDWAVWHVDDNGDVAPRWRIPMRIIGRQNAGIAVVPKYKEIMITSSQANKLVTFYFPEMFE
jgi:6-phosphogluconolactonase (cycloisomerase 2 family)